MSRGIDTKEKISQGQSRLRRAGCWRRRAGGCWSSADVGSAGADGLLDQGTRRRPPLQVRQTVGRSGWGIKHECRSRKGQELTRINPLPRTHYFSLHLFAPIAFSSLDPQQQALIKKPRSKVTARVNATKMSFLFVLRIAVPQLCMDFFVTFLIRVGIFVHTASPR